MSAAEDARRSPGRGSSGASFGTGEDIGVDGGSPASLAVTLPD